MTATIAGKVALVTGGSRGIGKAAALALSKAGARVAVNYKKGAAEAATVCAEIGLVEQMPREPKPL